MHDYLTAIAPVLQEVARTAPFVGRTVQLRDKKNFGRVGVVTWHGVDRYSNATRYCDDAQAHLRECGGRWGYRIGVRLEDGKTIFTSAEKVIVAVV